MFLVRRVVGESMLPALVPGSLVVARRNKVPVQGDIVIARATGREVVKRVTSVTADGVFLIGDNLSKSTDSRQYGKVKKSDILGVVIFNTHTMGKFHLKEVKATEPPRVTKTSLLAVPYSLAAAIALMLLAMLITFDKFVTSIDSYMINGVYAKLFATGIILSLLFALPFLLRMRLSPLARAGSILCSLAAPVMLLYLTLLSLNYGITADSYTYSLSKLYAHTWAYAFGIFLFALSVWSFYILKGPYILKTLNKQ